jgi:hypothetical protein
VQAAKPNPESGTVQVDPAGQSTLSQVAVTHSLVTGDFKKPWGQGVVALQVPFTQT